MLLRDAQLVCLLVNLHRSSVTVILDPVPKLAVGTIGVIIAVVVTESQIGHSVLRGLGTRTDRLGRSIDRPILLGKSGISVELCRLALDALHQLVITLPLSIIIDNGPGSLSVSAVVSGRTVRAVLLRLLLRVLGRVLENERRQLVTHVDVGALAARLAVPDDRLVLHDEQVGLRVLAGLAQDEFVDEDVQEFAELGGVVRSVDDVPLVLLVERRLRAELASEELGGVRGRTTERASDVCHVRNDRLDTITFTLDLRQQEGHTTFGQR